MRVTTTGRYKFNQKDFAKNYTLPLGEQNLTRFNNIVDKIRLNTHEQIGFKENRWEQGGVGDLDAHVRWNYFLDHRLLMRSINIDTQIGCIFPTGVKSDANNPHSVPFMGN